LIDTDGANVVIDRVIDTLDSMSIRTALVLSAVPRIVDYLNGRLPDLDTGFPARLRTEHPRLFGMVMKVCRRHVVIAVGNWGFGDHDAKGHLILPPELASRFEPTPAEVQAGLITVNGLEKRQTVTVALPAA
jgi:hypothetical protein